MIALVTGASDGIGKATADELERRGWEVLRHTRKQADFTRLDEVRKMAGELPEIDVLINNAGVLTREHRLTRDGFEETLQVNHLAHFLLTHLLLSKIRGRIINVSSGVYGGGEVEPFERLNELSGYDAYAASKLGNVLFTYALARRVKLPVVALHPGVIGTKLLRAGFGSMGGNDVAEGARTSVMLATQPELATAGYYSNQRQVPSSARSQDEALQERFYLWSAKQLGVTPP